MKISKIIDKLEKAKPNSSVKITLVEKTNCKKKVKVEYLFRDENNKLKRKSIVYSDLINDVNATKIYNNYTLRSNPNVKFYYYYKFNDGKYINLYI